MPKEKMKPDLLPFGLLVIFTSLCFLDSCGALFSPSSDKCAPGEYWCQDRCGSDAVGTTCCTTPDGQHNLCGVGTICCQYGCCPTGSICNAVGGCDTPSSKGSAHPPPAVEDGPACPSSTLPPVTLTKTSTRGYKWMAFGYVRTTITLTTCTGSTSGLPPATTLPTTTWTDASGAPVVSSASVIIINGTETIPVPTVTGTVPLTVTTGSHTFTFMPPVTAQPPPPPPPPPSNIITTTGSDGQTIIVSGSVIQSGTSVSTLPPITAPTTLVTGGVTFTLQPPSAPTGIPPPQVTTLPNGETFTFPIVTAPSTIIIDSTTLTALPPPAGTSGAGQPPPPLPPPAVTTTLSGGETLIFSSLTAPTTITMGSTTLTVSPPPAVPTGAPPPVTTTLPNGETLTFSSLTSPTTVTAGGSTFTILPPLPGTTNVQPSVTRLPDGNTFTFPATLTAPSTVTAGGTTFTLLPPSPPSPPLLGTTTTSSSTTAFVPIVTTLPNGQPFTFPSVTGPSTITAGGATFTVLPPPVPTGQVPLPTGPSFTVLPGGSTFTYPCFTATTTSTVVFGTDTIILDPSKQFGIGCATPPPPPLPLPTGPSFTVLPGGSTFTYPCFTATTTSTIVFGTDTVVLDPSKQFGIGCPTPPPPPFPVPTGGPSFTVLPGGSTFTYPCFTATTTSTVVFGTDTIILDPSKQFGIGCATPPPVPFPTGGPSVTVLPGGSTYTYPCYTETTTSTVLFGGDTIVLDPAKQWGIGCPTPPPLLTFSTWPADKTILPVSTSVQDDSPQSTGGGGGGGKKRSCKLWFFSVCISWGGIEIGGWEWPDLIPGVYPPCVGPGSCPPISWPPGVSVSLAPWPRMTIGPDHKLTFPPKPGGSEGCKTEWGTVEITTASFALSTAPSTTRTVSSTVMSTSLTYPGCEATDSATATAVTSTAACTLEPTASANNRRQLVQPNTPDIDFSCERPSDDTYVIWIKEDARRSSGAKDIRNLLEKRKQQNQRDYQEVNGTTATYLFLGYKMHADVARVFEKQPAVWGKVEIEDRKRVREDDSVMLDHVVSGKHREIDMNITKIRRSPLLPRALDTRTSARTWELSQISVPHGVNWNQPSEPGESTDYRVWKGDGTEEYTAYWDDSYGEGQLIYIMEQGLLEDHNEFKANPPAGYLEDTNDPIPRRIQRKSDWDRLTHGTGVASMAVGNSIGVAPKARWKMADYGGSSTRDLVLYTDIQKDVRKEGAQGKAVVNLSNGYPAELVSEQWRSSAADILNEMINIDKIAIISSTGRDDPREDARRNDIPRFPANFGITGRVPDLITVGASDKKGRRVLLLPYNTEITTFSPAVNIYAASPKVLPGVPPKFPENPDDWKIDDFYWPQTGTSWAAPRVAGLVAYLRAAPQVWAGGGDLTVPANVKRLITYLHRELDPDIEDHMTEDMYARRYPELDIGDDPPKVPVIWNGMNGPTNCLQGGNNNNNRKRQDTDAGSCPLLPRRPDLLPPSGTITPTPASITVDPTPRTSKTTSFNCLFTTTTTSCVTVTSGSSTMTTSCVTRPACTTPPASAFPTITDGPKITSAISTPSGSSCASTVTESSCALGVPPGQSACITGIACASWVSVFKPPAPTGGFWLGAMHSDVSDPPGMPVAVLAIPDSHTSCDKQKSYANFMQYIVEQEAEGGVPGRPTVTLDKGVTFRLTTFPGSSRAYNFCDSSSEGTSMNFKPVVRNGRTWDDYLEFVGSQGEPPGPKGFCTYDQGSFCAPRTPAERFRRVWHCMVDGDPGWCNNWEHRDIAPPATPPSRRGVLAREGGNATVTSSASMWRG